MGGVLAGNCGELLLKIMEQAPPSLFLAKTLPIFFTGY